ncbi:PssE/Cps14G family polysaccharide biosynthesis glycosyltransferase [Clostridium nigeriense]|uniref:PssE/Cps14G family polysaccharide biosynthesis glycosyltransferase n=1 Tax=Clostridium nigeriense TaxID=1805470 RepID=UPI003D34B5DC
MIFITVGSQKFQFNRLLSEIDKLIGEKKLTEEVFAQTGYSDYIPKNYKYKDFLDRDEFKEIMEKCDKVITHGGTGAIISAVKQGKKVIAIPRLKKYGEHVDNHQIEIVNQFSNMNLICKLDNLVNIVDAIRYIENREFKTYCSNTQKIISSIEKFINN